MAESQNKRVLIVDNNEEEARTLALMLEGGRLRFEHHLEWARGP